MKLFKIGLSLILLLLNITMLSAKELNLTDFKPIYTVNMEGHNVGCELLINDIPVLSNDYSGTISKFLINPCLINSRNTFKIRSLPVDSATRNHPQFTYDAMLCKVVISGLKDIGMLNITLAQPEMKPTESDPIISKDGSFIVTLGHPNPAWAQSEMIGKDAETQKKILDKYREFHLLLEEKDLDGIMKFSSAKFKEYSKTI